MQWTQAPVIVRTPASSANLGPGFDSFALALALYDEVELAVAGSALHVDVVGQSAGRVPRDEGHLVVRAARAAFDVLDVHPPGLRLRCRNIVPHGRGLGSSSAAIVSGIVAARTLVERSEPGAAGVLAGAATLRLAAELEGHPDNVAAALLGGVTIAWTEPAGPHAVRLEPAVSATVLVPDRSVPTEVARAVIPGDVPHGVAAANSARAGLLSIALTARPELLLPATMDRLHQDYRESAMPESLALVRRLRSLGHAAVVSGAGPAVLVLGDSAGTGSRPRTEVDALAAEAPGWQLEALAVDLDGARVLT